MGLVVDYVHSLVTTQLKDHGLAVWFDPEACYRDVVEDLKPTPGTVARYEGSFFALRHEIDSLLDADERPGLLVYVPLDQAATEHALAELEGLGVVMKPGQQPPTRDTRLSAVVRAALKGTGKWTDEDAEQMAQDVEAGRYASLEEIERAVERRGEATGVLQLVFGSADASEVALQFLSDTAVDAKLQEKQALPELARLMSPAFGAPAEAKTPAAYRPRLARHVLATDLAASLQGAVPEALSTVAVTPGPAAEACVELARTWRLRRDLRASYAELAGRVEKQIGLGRIEWALDQIAHVESFLGVERALQRMVEGALLEAPTPELVETARARQGSFWSEQHPRVRARWALMTVCGQVLLEADHVEAQLKSVRPAPEALFAAYSQGEQPWCLLDTYHRHMERRYHNYDFSGERQPGLQRLLAKARERYGQAASGLAEAFVRSYEGAGFRLPGALRQTEVFGSKVMGHLGHGKVAYVWVDALRFEMGRELAATLSPDFEVELQPALAAVPTITEIGMAALLPGVHGRASVAPAGPGRLALVVKGQAIKDVGDRVAWLEAHAGGQVFATTTAQLLPRPGRKAREGIRQADLVLVTSREIDMLCEGDNVPLARRTMDDVLHQLRRIFRSLTDLGVQRIVIAADHGYIFGDELGSEMKINAPGGDTADLHRRVWVGKGGGADPSYLRAKLSNFGLGGELEIAAPWNLACFKVKGGAKAYFHGGLAPQELIVPVITLVPRRKVAPVLSAKVAWELVPGAATVTTRFISVQVRGTATSLFDLEPPKVRVEVRDDGKRISTPVSASYGFEEATGDVQLRCAEEEARTIDPNTVALMLREEPSQSKVAVHLLEATSGAELARIVVPAAITF